MDPARASPTMPARAPERRHVQTLPVVSRPFHRTSQHVHRTDPSDCCCRLYGGAVLSFFMSWWASVVFGVSPKPLYRLLCGGESCVNHHLDMVVVASYGPHPLPCRFCCNVSPPFLLTTAVTLASSTPSPTSHPTFPGVSSPPFFRKGFGAQTSRAGWRVPGPAREAAGEDRHHRLAGWRVAPVTLRAHGRRGLEGGGGARVLSPNAGAMPAATRHAPRQRATPPPPQENHPPPFRSTPSPELSSPLFVPPACTWGHGGVADTQKRNS